MSTRNIRRLFAVIDTSLFMTTGKLDYDRITDAIIVLANAIHENDSGYDGDSIWYIGEGSVCDLSGLIVGAYWHYTEWHSGQSSPGYAALSALSQVFQPGMTNMESERADGSSSVEAHDALESSVIHYSKHCL